MDAHRNKKDDLKSIFALNEVDFHLWISTLDEEELDYVESLFDEVEEKLDEVLLTPDKCVEASKIFSRF